MSRKKHHVVAEWERQTSESSPAFAAFAEYRDLGPERSLRVVVQKVGKSKALLERWSRGNKWVKRARAYDDHMDEIRRHASEQALRTKYRGYMSSTEVIERMSMLAKGDITDLIDDTGQINLIEVKKRGLGSLIRTVTYHTDHSIARIELYDGKSALETMGKYYKLWERGERPIDDPRRVLAHLLGLKVEQLPPGRSEELTEEFIDDEMAEADRQEDNN